MRAYHVVVLGRGLPWCFEPVLAWCWSAVYDVGPALAWHWFDARCLPSNSSCCDMGPLELYVILL